MLFHDSTEVRHVDIFDGECVPENHDNDKTAEGNSTRQDMAVVRILEQKREFVQAAAVSYKANFLCPLLQAHLGNQLVDENDKANGADEAP